MDSTTASKIVQRSVPSPSVIEGLACHPKLMEVLRSRGVTSAEDLDYQLNHLPRPEQLANIHVAADILAAAITQNKHILIVGDFDCDGATGVSVGMLGLSLFGAKRVSYLVPNRFDFGYGLTPELVEHSEALKPDVIVTVDNGISSVTGVAAAKARGWQVIVTDHHLPGDQLPDADAIVNPNLANCTFPSKAIAGVSVMFYVLVMLRRVLNTEAATQANLASLLDLVALGTVADVVPLDRVNRLLVSQGLARIRAGYCRPGIKALLALSGRNPAKITASDLGFAVGPRINAAGRLDDIEVGIKCLLATDDEEALAYAKQLDALNRDRREIEQSIKSEADKALNALGNIQRTEHSVVLFHPDWHQGVVGIVASRIKEQHHRPTFVFAKEDENFLKGSGRSIPGVHLRDALDLVDKRCPGIIKKFGGHAMAAGLSLRADALEPFQQALNSAVIELASADCFEQRFLTDGELPIDAFDLGFVREIERLGPWGQAFPEPAFSGTMEVASWRILKDVHLKLSLRTEGGKVVDAIAFNATELVDRFKRTPPDELSLVFRLSINEWQGQQSLQLMVVYAE